MVSAAYYVGTIVDHDTLLDYLGEPESVTLVPWPVVTAQAIRVVPPLRCRRGSGSPDG